MKEAISKTPKSEGAIIILDVLGIKGIWKNQDPEKVMEEYIRLLSPSTRNKKEPSGGNCRNAEE